jgi:hypothetical protein
MDFCTEDQTLLAEPKNASEIPKLYGDNLPGTQSYQDKLGTSTLPNCYVLAK